MSLAGLAQRDPIFRRIGHAVPRNVDAALREDIISEMYLEIREGRLHPHEIEAEVKRFISAAFAAWANPWGDLSLSAGRSREGDGNAFVEAVEDQEALAAFDRVVFQSEVEQRLQCAPDAL